MGELKDKTHKYSIMSSTDEQIDKYNAKILKLTDDISKCADEDMVEMMTMTIDGYKNKINEGMAALTGVVHDTAKAAAADRELIKEQTRMMEADLNKALNRAISIGEAKAKAVEQRIAEHLKNTKRYLQVELNES